VIKQTQEYAKKLGDPTARNYYIKFVYYIMKAVELEMAWKRLNESARHDLAKIVPNTHNYFNRWSKTGIAFMPPKAPKDMIPALADEIGGPNFNVTDETLIKYHRFSLQEAREFYHKFVTFATMPVGLEDDWKSLNDTARNSILQLTFM